jgi:hypothetical protein
MTAESRKHNFLFSNSHRKISQRRSLEETELKRQTNFSVLFESKRDYFIKHTVIQRIRDSRTCQSRIAKQLLYNVADGIPAPKPADHRIGPRKEDPDREQI